MTKKTYKLIEQLRELGFTFEEANNLRRIENTLRRWFEYECGTENERGTSFSIEREGGTDDGKPFMRVQFIELCEVVQSVTTSILSTNCTEITK